MSGVVRRTGNVPGKLEEGVKVGNKGNRCRKMGELAGDVTW